MNQRLLINSASAHEHTLRTVYDAVGTPSFEDRLLDCIRRGFDGNFAGLRSIDPRAPSRQLFKATLSWNVDEVQRIFEPYAHENLWFLRGQELIKIRGVSHGDEVASMREVRRTGYYHEVLRRLDCEHSMAVLLWDQGHGNMTLLSVTRDKHRSSFDETDLVAAEALLPHLRNAWRLHGSIAMLQDRCAQAMALAGETEKAMFVRDHEGRVKFANTQAKLTLSVTCGARIDGELIRPERDADQFQVNQLLALISLAPDRVARRGIFVGLDGRPALVVRCSRLPESAKGGHVAVVLDQVGNARDQSLTAVYTEALGLTSAEARFARWFSATASLAATAKGMGVGIGTARTHLKHIFAKANVGSQAELSRLLALIERS